MRLIVLRYLVMVAAAPPRSGDDASQGSVDRCVSIVRLGPRQPAPLYGRGYGADNRTGLRLVVRFGRMALNLARFRLFS
jgi:hypothetical protein